MKNEMKFTTKLVAKIIFIFSNLSLIFIFSGVLLIILVISNPKGENVDINCVGGLSNEEQEKISFLMPTIEEEMKKNEIPEKYEDYLLAQLKQESGMIDSVLHSDPWQSSESLCGHIGCITDPKQSTAQAMKIHRENLDKAERLKLENNYEAVLQAYNYGSGYLDYLYENNKEHSEEVAKEFSIFQTEKYPEFGESCPLDPEDKKACYGDYKYVSNIKQQMICSDIVFDGKLTKLPLKEYSYIISQPYGQTGFSLEDEGWHDGIDMVAEDGAEVYSAGDGIVVFSGKDSNGANAVTIMHSEKLYTNYWHLKEPSKLNVGDKVSAGDLIGYQGSTGLSTGSHLHFETSRDAFASNKKSYNPEDLLPISDYQKK